MSELTLNDCKALELDAVVAMLPSTYYASLSPHVRVGFMATSWNNSIKVNSELEDINAEQQSEIARHHELIVELRTILTWALDALEVRDVTGSPDDEKYFAARRYLNREVG